MLFIHTDEDKTSDVEIKIHVTETSITINSEPFEKTYTLDDLNMRNDFRDFCLMMFPLSNIGKIQMRDDNLNVYYKSPSIPPFDAFSQSYNSKSKYLSHLQAGTNFPICVMFYPETKNFKEAVLIVQKQKDNVPFKITTTNSKGEIIDYSPDYEGPYISNRLLPKCELRAENIVVNKNDQLEIEFIYKNMDSIEMEINFHATVKTDKGYISHSKIDVKHGRGKFKFIPLGLDSGEKATIECGIGKYTSLCDISISVV